MIWFLPAFNLEIGNAVFSDHMPVSFEVALACNTVKPSAAARCCRSINPSTAVHFSAVSDLSKVIPESKDTEEQSCWFHNTCPTVLDSVGPLKTDSLELNLSPG